MVYSRETQRRLAGEVAEFAPDVAYIHNIYPLISPSIYHSLHAARVASVQVIHDYRPFCINGWFYKDDQVCELCKRGNLVHAVRKRCFRGDLLLSGTYAACMAVNRVAGMLRKISAYICLTEFARRKLIEAGVAPDRLHVNANFLDTDGIPACSPVANRFVFAGRLSREKGVWTLLRAFESLPEAELVIIGTGPEEALMREYARDRRLRNVSFAGFLSGREKYEVWGRSTATLMPSTNYEGLPITLLESFALSRPVIASELGAYTCLIEPGKTGCLCPPGDPLALATAVRTILKDPSAGTRMGRAARSLVDTTYSRSAHGARLETIFNAARERVQAHA
jgi:glycosyltransferase involved in cell wall biosynthesis